MKDMWGDEILEKRSGGHEFKNKSSLDHVYFASVCAYPPRHMPGTPMTREEMEAQCRLVSSCPEIPEDLEDLSPDVVEKLL